MQSFDNDCVVNQCLNKKSFVPNAAGNLLVTPVDASVAVESLGVWEFDKALSKQNSVSKTSNKNSQNNVKTSKTIKKTYQNKKPFFPIDMQAFDQDCLSLTNPSTNLETRVNGKNFYPQNQYQVTKHVDSFPGSFQNMEGLGCYVFKPDKVWSDKFMNALRSVGSEKRIEAEEHTEYVAGLEYRYDLGSLSERYMADAMKQQDIQQTQIENKKYLNSLEGANLQLDLLEEKFSADVVNELNSSNKTISENTNSTMADSETQLPTTSPLMNDVFLNGGFATSKKLVKNEDQITLSSKKVIAKTKTDGLKMMKKQSQNQRSLSPLTTKRKYDYYFDDHIQNVNEINQIQTENQCQITSRNQQTKNNETMPAKQFAHVLRSFTNSSQYEIEKPKIQVKPLIESCIMVDGCLIVGSDLTMDNDSSFSSSQTDGKIEAPSGPAKFIRHRYQ